MEWKSLLHHFRDNGGFDRDETSLLFLVEIPVYEYTVHIKFETAQVVEKELNTAGHFSHGHF